jgi:hypothetical protein
VKGITQELRGDRVSASTVSNLNQKIYKQVEERPQWPPVADFLCLRKRLVVGARLGGEVKNVSIRRRLMR